MKTETIPYKNKNHWLQSRTMDITSTESAALFGLSPYTTLFELWHHKKTRQITEIAENERMKWGTRLQDTIAKGIAEDNGWNIIRMNDYLRLPDLRLGASFDFQIGVTRKNKGVGLLEIKNVDSLIFKNTWLTDTEEEEAPPHIEVQVQHQLLVSKCKYAYIGALVGGNKVALFKRERNETIMHAIIHRAEQFWKAIDNNKPPKPDFEVDAKFISTLYADAIKGSIINLTNDPLAQRLAERYQEINKQTKELEKAKDAIKAELLMKIGTAEKATGAGFSISAGKIAGTKVEAYFKKPYRTFRIYLKKMGDPSAN